MAEKIIRADQVAGMGIIYHYFSLKYMLEAQKRAGFKSIELFCASPHVQMTAEGIAHLPELKAALRESGMKVICVTPDNCGSPWQYAASGKETIEQSRRYFRHTLELATELDCTQVACHSGWGLLDEDHDEAWKRSLDFMNWYADEAEKMGVRLVMESLRAAESNLVNSLPTLEKYLGELGHRNIKPMIDTCAMSVAGEDIADWFKVFGSEISHMHFVDSTPYFHLAWGDGNRSLAHYMQVIKENGYTGYLTQELTDGRYYDDPAAADAKTFATLRPYMK